MIRSLGDAPAARFATWLGILCGTAAPAHADYSLRAGAGLMADDYGYRAEQYRLELFRIAPNDSQWLSARFHRYALEHELVGIRAFEGSEPAAALGGHLLYDRTWIQGSVGVQGGFGLDFATAEATLAHAISIAEIKLTPRLGAAREPLAMTPLPLSLGIMSRRAELALDFESALIQASAAGRVVFSDSVRAPGRSENPDRDEIAENRLGIVYGYALVRATPWFSAGLSGKVAWAESNTLLLTQLTPRSAYTWYPISAPPFEWGSALVLRAAGYPAESLELSLQLQMPLLSAETRQWEDVRRTYRGSAAFEARSSAAWAVTEATKLALALDGFAKPWADWDPLAPEAYRQIQGSLFAEQRF